MKKENGIVEIEATDTFVGTVLLEGEVDTLICNNQFITNLNAPNVRNIFVNNNHGLQSIKASKALTIECSNCSTLMKINAPSCVDLICENTPALFLDKVDVSKNCKIYSGGELKFKSEKYAYVEMENGTKYDRTNNITKERGLLDWGLNEYAILRSYMERKGKLFTTAEIVLCDNNDITSIEAPNARYVSCENCKNLKKVNAPNCTHIYCKGSDKLNLFDMNIFPTCQVRGLEGVMIGELETVSKNEKEYLHVYKVVERDVNGKEENIRFFQTEEEAKNYADIIDIEVGKSSIVKIWEAPKSCFIEEMYQEEFHSLEELFDRHSENFDLTREGVIKYNEGKDIMGGIVVAWEWEKYIGYGRNLEGVGVAGADGTLGYYNLKTEADLITGNEENTYGTNYSLLLSPDEIKRELGNNYTEEELTDFIDEKLKDNIWLWNNFKNNSEDRSIRRDIEEVVKNKVGTYAFIEQENGERKDISFHFDEKRKSTLNINNDGYSGELKTNVEYLYCNNNEFKAIEADRAVEIHCEDNEQLERIEATACKELHCDNCSELSKDNINVPYNCEIKGLEKRNQLKV